VKRKAIGAQLFDSEAARDIADGRIFREKNYVKLSGCGITNTVDERVGPSQLLQTCAFEMLRCRSGTMLLLLVVSMTTSSEDHEEGLVTLTYSVLEERPAGTELGDLLVDTGLVTAVNRSLIDQIYFSVLPGKHKSVTSSLNLMNVSAISRLNDTIRDAILTCAQKLT